MPLVLQTIDARGTSLLETFCQLGPEVGYLLQTLQTLQTHSHVCDLFSCYSHQRACLTRQHRNGGRISVASARLTKLIPGASLILVSTSKCSRYAAGRMVFPTVWMTAQESDLSARMEDVLQRQINNFIVTLNYNLLYNVVKMITP